MSTPVLKKRGVKLFFVEPKVKRTFVRSFDFGEFSENFPFRGEPTTHVIHTD